MNETILVTALVGIDRAALEDARRTIAHTFLVDALEWEARADFEPPPDPERGQIESTLVLRRLFEAAPAENRILGLTASDLFLPALSFVFGHAQLDGRVAVVSNHRLKQETYGLPADPTLTLERTRREIAHELGHTYGLRHCDDRSCCMSLSTCVEDVDAKTASFCRGCRVLVREAQQRQRRNDRSRRADRDDFEEARR